MWALLSMGTALNLAIVVTNYLFFYGHRTERVVYFLYALPFILVMFATAAFVALQVFQGLTEREWTAFRLSFLTLLLSAPLIPLWLRDIRAPG